MKKLITSACAVLLASLSWSADLPKPGPHDSRVRLITYKPNDVALVVVQRGTATRIVLAPDEKIEVPVTGFSSRCENDLDEWCISAQVGANQVFVRPKDRATHNNLELHTNLRDYSFEFEVLPDPSNEKSKKSTPEKAPFFRVVFEYPSPPLASRSVAAAGVLAAIEQAKSKATTSEFVPGMSPSAQLKLQPPEVKNANYSMQVLTNGEDAAPSLVFDDGRFTYFEFKGNREIPAIFAYGSDGEPTRVNWHMQAPLVVVQRTARKFTLRIGAAVVGVFNDSYDVTGIDTPNGTISPTVIRESKEVAK